MVKRKLSRPALFLFLAALILLLDCAAARWSHGASEDRLIAYAVLFDLMLVVPLLYWFLVARPAGKPFLRILPFAALGTFVSWLVLPAALKETAWTVYWPLELLLIAAEALILFYEGRLLYRAAGRFRELVGEEPDTAERLRRAVREVLGEGVVSSVLLHDALMLYYVFCTWTKKADVTPSDSKKYSYTYHRNNNQILYAAMLTKILLLETAALHLIVQTWSTAAAWLLTAADLWLLTLIWADCRASVLQPVRLSAGGLRLRYGLRIQADLPWNRIASVEGVEWDVRRPEERRAAVLPLFGTPNVRIRLRSPARVQGLLLLPCEVTAIYLSLDEPERFIQEWGLMAQDQGDRL
ncbi:hypothetical protein J2T17_004793 [Paenibacillus mucilaginosus]|uniref:hypothetical protein n=1 Tax=Paenibacillus mucilaginosus TaxID=61624 RepID=UPI003D22CDCB